MVFSTSRKGGRGVCPGTFVILGMLCALPGAVVASIGTAVVVPAADAVVLSRDDTAMATAASAAATRGSELVLHTDTAIRTRCWRPGLAGRWWGSAAC